MPYDVSCVQVRTASKLKQNQRSHYKLEGQVGTHPLKLSNAESRDALGKATRISNMRRGGVSNELRITMRGCARQPQSKQIFGSRLDLHDPVIKGACSAQALHEACSSR